MDRASTMAGSEATVIDGEIEASRPTSTASKPKPASGAAFRVEDYFDGRVRGCGLFQDRFGKVRQRFDVTIDGAWDGDEFVLRERFEYDNAEPSYREWRIKVLGEGRYEGRAADVIGTAKGRSEPGTILWQYTLAVPVGERVWHMSFDDRMFIMNDGKMLNISDARKWGFRLGRVILSFEKES